MRAGSLVGIQANVILYPFATSSSRTPPGAHREDWTIPSESFSHGSVWEVKQHPLPNIHSVSSSLTPMWNKALKCKIIKTCCLRAQMGLHCGCKRGRKRKKKPVPWERQNRFEAQHYLWRRGKYVCESLTSGTRVYSASLRPQLNQNLREWPLFP